MLSGYELLSPARCGEINRFGSTHSSLSAASIVAAIDPGVYAPSAKPMTTRTSTSDMSPVARPLAPIKSCEHKQGTREYVAPSETIGFVAHDQRREAPRERERARDRADVGVVELQVLRDDRKQCRDHETIDTDQTKSERHQDDDDPVRAHAEPTRRVADRAHVRLACDATRCSSEASSQRPHLILRPGTKPYAALEAETTGIDLRLQVLVRAGVTVELRNDGAVYIECEIEPDQIGVLEWTQHGQPQTKAALHAFIERLCVADSFGDHGDGFAP